MALGCDEDREGAVLEARAVLPARATAPAPFPAAPDRDPVPAPGSGQPVGGFSALLDGPGESVFLAMADNGFGTKANSRSFLLRVYRLDAAFETGDGGRGELEVRDWITLRDPDERVPFPIVNGRTRERLLTGGDFDVESLRADAAGTLWFGDEFGPFLLHTDATGKVLDPPVALPGVTSPDSPSRDAASRLGRSRGFEGMAISPDRRTLYPILEGPLTGDDERTRRIYEFDVVRRQYEDMQRTYRVADAGHAVADLAAVDGDCLLALERDDGEGAAARHKRVFAVDLRTTEGDGSLVKREVLDLLDVEDPARISEPGRPGDIGIGEAFSMPYANTEAILPLAGDRLAVVNDTNFGSRGRNPARDDDSDLIVVRAAGETSCR